MTLFFRLKIGSATVAGVELAVGSYGLLCSFGPRLVHGSGIAEKLGSGGPNGLPSDIPPKMG
ncbi:MAG: hypothetical protein K2Q34_07895 [Alphaproteobacteria bacterium]|nr:hypothetical protein [Alphaproteobacteria bacterium]